MGIGMSKSRIRRGVGLLVVWFASSAAPGAESQPSLEGQIAGLVTAYEASSKALAGVSVVDLRTAQVVAARRETELFIPASNQKLLTSAAALARLGGDFTFVTNAYLVGRDLWVIGSGDPTSGDPYLAQQAGTSIYAEFDRWAGVLKPKLGKALEGDIVLVPCFGPENRSPMESCRHGDWPRNQHQAWYAAPVAGLNFNDNCFDVTFQVQGGRVVPVVSPRGRLIKVIDALAPGGKHNWSLWNNGDDSELTIKGTAKTAGSDPVNCAVDHPPLLFGRVLADRIERAGVAFRGKVRVAQASAIPPGLGRPVCGTATPLAVVMARANKRSLNMTAECMFLRAGDGTWAGSAKIVTQTLVESCGAPARDLDVRDGGGLSHNNRVSPSAMTRILTEVLKRPDSAILVNSLPISGVDGTLERRLNTPLCRGRVLGKTGYVNRVTSLSGYVLDKDGKPAMAYSILLNRVPMGKGWQGKALEDSICKLLVESLGAKQPSAAGR